MTLIRQANFPRLPLDGNIDLTYRCNNHCRHCWLWVPQNASEGRDELSFSEIQTIVQQARAMGCQSWSISGGEPMLRPDFAEIFDYITRKSIFYKLNTNGTLITPEIARLLTRKGIKMVALYGATADVHDHVTRTPGSFEATMRGFAYLKEAGANFTVQIVPIRENYHQYKEMVALAQTLSDYNRLGAAWLWLTGCNDEVCNREIRRQRLDPKDALLINPPNPASEIYNGLNSPGIEPRSGCDTNPLEDYLFASCIEARRDFHIDPYGQMSFCYYIKDPALRYDLRKGSFQEAWEVFIPSLAKMVRGGQEYMENCGTCDLRQDCKWCGVFGYLEHGRYAAKVDYLCQVAAETRRFKEEWKLSNLRYYQIAGITIQLTADFPFTEATFDPKFEKFRVEGPGEDTISIQLSTSKIRLSTLKLGQEVYRSPPWAIYRQRDSWIYRGISPNIDNQTPLTLAIINQDHSQIIINLDIETYNTKALQNFQSLTTFPTDQILLAQVLANRQACYIHSSAIVINGKGLLFVGHSEVGKSTMMKMLRGMGEILCDDRNIVRRWPDGFRVHGTWSHGELPDVSSAGAPLLGIFFLEQAQTNQLIPITETRERLSQLLTHVVRPLVTADWWEKTLNLAGRIASEVPIYRLKFDQSGQVVDLLRQLYD